MPVRHRAGTPPQTLGVALQVRHGTNRGWEAGCRESCCQRARHRFYKFRSQQAGTPNRMLPADNAIKKVRKLRDIYGWTFDDVVHQTGLSASQVRRWYTGDASTIQERSLRKLMRLPDRKLKRGEGNRLRVPAEGASRRLQAMAKRGFTLGWASRHCSLSDRHLGEIRSGKVEFIHPDTHEEIVKLSNLSLTLEDPQGRYADRTRSLAEQKGWQPLGVWVNIDDPHDEPETPMEPELNALVARLKKLQARGFLLSQMARTAGTSPSTLSKILLGRFTSVRTNNLNRLYKICDTLEPLPDPEGSEHDECRRKAASRGW